MDVKWKERQNIDRNKDRQVVGINKRVNQIKD